MVFGGMRVPKEMKGREEQKARKDTRNVHLPILAQVKQSVSAQTVTFMCKSMN